MMHVKDILTDDLIDSIWGNSDFGQTSKCDVIRFALLKYACGYSTGHTAKRILQELELIHWPAIPRGKENLTAMGKLYLYAAFFQGNSL